MIDTKTLRRSMMLAALGLAAASTATAQGTQPSRPGERVRDAVGKRGQPAPAPAPAPPTKTPGAAVSGAATADPSADARNAIFAALSVRNGHAVELGQLATQRGASDGVKQLGQRLVTEHQKLESDLAALVASRGLDLASLPKPDVEQASHRQLVQRLQGLTGAEFDREFVMGVRDVQAAYVEDLKAMRDRTPGQDAALKTWLDTTENQAEERLTATRQAKQALDAQRAASR